MCGDSTDADAVAKLMNGERADMCFTDPPYGVSYEGGLNDVKRKQIKNDALRGDSLYNFLVPVFENIKAFTIQKAAIYIFYAHSSTLQFINALYDAKLKQRSILIWKKIGGGFGDFMAQYMNAYEPCIYASNGDTVNWYGPTNEKTVWEMEKEHVCDLHPTMKPIPLVGRVISNSSKEGDIVIDLFGGSGSTMIACEQLKRKARLMELDPHYCNVIIARWEKFTGLKAEKVE
jgi:DNA modification methylase